MLFQGSSLADVVIFTDGYYPDPRVAGGDQTARVGWLILERDTGIASVGSWDITDEYVQKWIPRKTQIVLVETFAAVLAIEALGDKISNKTVLLFVDAEATQAALIKGYSAKEDMCGLVGYFWEMCADLSAGVYIDRVSTDANPADGPSRGTCKQLQACGALRMWATPSETLKNASPSGRH